MSGRVAAAHRASRVTALPWFAAALVLLSALMLAPGTGRAQQTAAVAPEAMPTFGRLVLTFKTMPEYEVRSSTGVLVVAFKEPVSVDIRPIVAELKDYIGAARLDPDLMAVRLALTREITVNTMEAGEKLFIDFLPPGWRGLPPGLPADVVADLARRAREAEERARAEALREAGLMPNPDVEVSVGEYPTFSRIVFQWDRKVEPALTREGTRITIDFGTMGQVDLARVLAARPRLLRSASARAVDGHLVVDLKVDHIATVRGFSEDKSYVVDLSSTANPGVTAAGQDLAEAANAAVQPAEPEGPVTKLAGVADEPAQRQAEPARAPEAVSVSYSPFVPAQLGADAFADASATGFTPGKNDERPRTQARAAPEPEQKPEQKPQKAAPEEQRETADANEPAARQAPVQSGPAQSAPAPDGQVIVSAHRAGTSIRLTFPFPEKVAASVFMRAGVLWAVFDSDVPIDVDAIARDHPDRISHISVTRSGSMQYVRMTLVQRDLATASAEAKDWVVTIGDTILEPTRPLALIRRLATDGNPLVAVEIEDAGKVHWIRDPLLGDLLAVVTAFGPPRGLIKSQDFVEFTAFASAHGVAIRPIADDLRVTLLLKELIISRGGGLWLSAGGAHQYVAGRSDAGTGHRPGFLDFAALREGGAAKYLTRRRNYEEQAAVAEKEAAAPARLALARFYLAHDLSAEALGVLNRMSQQDKEIERDPAFNAARAIANIRMRRFEEARPDLAVHGLSQSLDTRLWLATVDAAAGNWRTAQLAFSEAEPVLGDYPADLQAELRMTAALAALEARDLADANYQLDALPDRIDSPELRAQALVLRGRYMEDLGRTDDALKFFGDVIDSDVRPAAAEAGYRQVALLTKLGRIKPEEAIARLETVSVAWRGDRTELRALRMLARLYADKGEFRRAFETLKSASIVDPDADITRQIQDEMAVVFEDLFLHGKADKMATIDALSLFYDYRNLTPVGRLGDEMIRRLADRMIGVNLLDQAAELLEYQVENRLKGPARAQIAAQLAMVYLKNHQPAKALRALHGTRMASLPGDLQRQRDLLQARGLAETGRHDQALDLLDTLQGDDIERLRADTLWQGRKWQKAAEQLENLLGGVWQDKAPLGDQDRYNVMRAAIAYSLADDQLGLDRLRTKFAGKMADSPDAKGFEVVTAPVTARGAAFDTLAQNIASIDTLDSFLEDVRKRFEAKPKVDMKPQAGATQEPAPAAPRG